MRIVFGSYARIMCTIFSAVCYIFCYQKFVKLIHIIQIYIFASTFAREIEKH